MSLGKHVVSAVLAVLMIAGVVSAVWTVIPDPSSYVSLSYKVSALGYPSHCPFAPYSTIISIAITLVAAGTYLIMRRRCWI